MSGVPREAIRRVYSRSTVFGQCRTWLAANLPALCAGRTVVAPNALPFEQFNHSRGFAAYQVQLPPSPHATLDFGGLIRDQISVLVDGRLGNTAVTVNASGLLGGRGGINGAVAVLAGGTLSPGNSPGILTVDSLSLFAGSHTLMEITGTAASQYDQIVGTGSAGLIYGGQLTLTMTGSQAYGLNTTFNLFKNFVTRSGSFSSVALAADGTPYAGLMFANIGGGVWETGSTAAPLGEYLRFEQSTGNIIVVPEPSTYALTLAGLACGGWQMWRRRRLRQAPPLAA
jgi:hypothetical protein